MIAHDRSKPTGLKTWVPQFCSMSEDAESDGGQVVPVMEEARPEERPDRRIEPGRPRVEHAVFVVLGMILTVLVFVRGLGFI